ncbi:MAG: dipeptidase, partial [Gammaproteobacteria bacterium]
IEENGWVDVSQATEGGDFDYPRAVAGGLNAPFMSIFTPAESEMNGAKDLADRLISMVEGIVAESPDKFAIAVSPAEVRANFDKGIMSLPLGMENGAPIEGDIQNLQHFYDRGIRYITLTHSKANHISDSSYDENRPNDGLSEFGVEVVHEMNRLGIMIDVSHVSDAAFYNVMEHSAVPVIASHSSARHFTPGWERNMDDDMIRALAKTAGVIQVNAGSAFITEVSNVYTVAMFDQRKAYLEENDLVDDKNASAAFEAGHRVASPFPYAQLGDFIDHIDHVVSLVGVNHVGIGSDFDGVGDSLPEGFKDVSYYPALIDGLLQRGYSESDIEKILGGNLLRVWQRVEDFAANTDS